MTEFNSDPDEEKSGVELLREWIETAQNRVELMPKETDDAWLDFGDRSVLGAVQRETGGILVENGWLRIQGSGSPKLPRTLSTWNIGRTTPDRSEPPRLLLVADDVVGGFFGLNWGGLQGSWGEVYYFAPDCLRWEAMDGFQYADFVRWALFEDLNEYYQSLRWPNWDTEVGQIRADQAFSILPPPWTSEGKVIANCSRRPIPIHEVFSLNVIDYPRQLGDSIPDCFLH